jgi:uncharacterized membrane protein YccF (DUF307 family)
MINLILNILWFLLGGLQMGLVWWFFGLIAFISIIGIPWGRSCFVIGMLSFWPFGKKVMDREELTSAKDIGTSVLGSIGNIVWFLFAGLWLAIAHLVIALFYCLTIIGIPFGVQHFKLAGLALLPIGKTIIDR